MKRLKIEDFTFEQSMVSLGYRGFLKLDDGREIDLESCLGGFDIAIYDKHLNLIGKKVCTNVLLLDYPFKAITQAIEIANDLLELTE